MSLGTSTNSKICPVCKTLHVSSGIEFHNDCGLAVNVSFLQNETLTYIGKCEANSRSLSHFGAKSNLIVKDGNVSKASRRVVVPVEIMKKFRLEYHSRGSSHLSFVVNPSLDSLPADWALSGTTNLHIEKQAVIFHKGKALVSTFDVVCRPVSLREGSSLPPRNLDPFVLQVSDKTTVGANSNALGGSQAIKTGVAYKY